MTDARASGMRVHEHSRRRGLHTETRGLVA